MKGVIIRILNCLDPVSPSMMLYHCQSFDLVHKMNGHKLQGKGMDHKHVTFIHCC